MKRRLAPYAVGRSRRSDASGGVALKRERRLKEKAACAAYAVKAGYVQGERCRSDCTLSPIHLSRCEVVPHLTTSRPLRVGGLFTTSRQRFDTPPQQKKLGNAPSL